MAARRARPLSLAPGAHTWSVPPAYNERAARAGRLLNARASGREGADEMRSAARFRGALLAALVAAAAVAAASSARAGQAASPQGTPQQDPAGAPRSLSMGGKKSVMT